MADFLPIEEQRLYRRAARDGAIYDQRARINEFSTRYYHDLRKATMEAFPDFAVIRDKHRADAIVAMCPINPGMEKVCEGQFSFVPVVLRALNVLDDEESI